jgi:hypothetical protein
MKRYARKALILCAVLAGGIGVLLLWDESRVGKVLDSYRGIPVYDNGQNILGHTRQRLSLIISNGHWSVTQPRTPAGWLRTPR